MALKRNLFQSVTQPKTPIVKDLKGFWMNDTNVLIATNNLLSDKCAQNVNAHWRSTLRCNLNELILGESHQGDCESEKFSQISESCLAHTRNLHKNFFCASISLVELRRIRFHDYQGITLGLRVSIAKSEVPTTPCSRSQQGSQNVKLTTSGHH